MTHSPWFWRIFVAVLLVAAWFRVTVPEPAAVLLRPLLVSVIAMDLMFRWRWAGVLGAHRRR